MVRIAVFYVTLIVLVAFALRRGGAPERTVAWMMFAAAVATSLAALLPGIGFAHVPLGVLAIDLGLLAGLCAVVVYADRYWPIWIAALQFLAIAIHGVRAYDPKLVPLVYAWAIGEIAYPMFALLAIGVVRHKRREALNGPERGW